MSQGIPRQPLIVPLGVGINSELDDKLVAPGSLLVLENAYSDKSGRIVKRPGYRVVSRPVPPAAPAEPGPFLADYMTLRQETAPSLAFPIEVSGSNVINWRNRVGSDLDSVERAYATPTLGNEDGIDHLSFNGPQALYQSVPGAGVFAPPTSPTELAPFHIFIVARANTEIFGARAILSDFTCDPGPGGPRLVVPFPVWSFKLVWQYLEDFSSNIATVADLSTTVTAKWCLYEWKCDGPTLTYMINGVVISCASTDPLGSMTALEVVDNVLGTTSAGGVDIDIRVRYVYKEPLPPAGELQTRDYLLETYPVDP